MENSSGMGKLSSLKFEKSGRKCQTGTDEKTFGTIDNAVGPTKFSR